jgi:hypothetical protein
VRQREFYSIINDIEDFLKKLNIMVRLVPGQKPRSRRQVISGRTNTLVKESNIFFKLTEIISSRATHYPTFLISPSSK